MEFWKYDFNEFKLEARFRLMDQDETEIHYCRTSAEAEVLVAELRKRIPEYHWWHGPGYSKHIVWVSKF